MGNTHWTNEERDRLSSLIGIAHGRVEWEAAFPGRSYDTIRKQIQACSLSNDRDYSPAEHILVVEKYPTTRMAELLIALPGRSRESIWAHAKEHGIKRAPESSEVTVRHLRDTVISHLTGEDRAYIAGLIDGEGCICFSKRTNRVGKTDFTIQVTVNNTDRRMIDWLMVKVPHGASFSEERPGARRKLILYRWTLGTYASITFLREIAPYLVIKREQAEALQNGYRHLSPADRLALHARMRELKTKGSTDLYGVPVKQRCSPS